MSKSQSLANCFASFRSEESCEMMAMTNEVACRRREHYFTLHFKESRNAVNHGQLPQYFIQVNYGSLSKFIVRAFIKLFLHSKKLQCQENIDWLLLFVSYVKTNLKCKIQGITT